MRAHTTKLEHKTFLPVTIVTHVTVSTVESFGVQLKNAVSFGKQSETYQLFTHLKVFLFCKLEG